MALRQKRFHQCFIVPSERRGGHDSNAVNFAEARACVAELGLEDSEIFREVLPKDAGNSTFCGPPGHLSLHPHSIARSRTHLDRVDDWIRLQD